MFGNRNNSDTIEIGTILRLGNGTESVTRRRFLKAVSLSGLGVFGLKGAIEKAYGQTVEGVPIIHTDDIYGNPDKVRIIPEERYQRIKTYSELDLRSFFEQHPSVNEITMAQQSDDENDIVFKLHFEPSISQTEKSNLPAKIQNVPVVYEARAAKWVPDDVGSDNVEPNDAGHDFNVCDARHQKVPLRGGAAIGGETRNDGTYYLGSLGLVAFDKNTNERVAITANHVMKGDDYMYQPDRGHADSRYVGKFKYSTPTSEDGFDTTSYEILSFVDAWPRVTWRNDVPNVQGAWRFGGLTDETSSGTVHCQHTGARNCRLQNRCRSTSRTDVLNKEANMKYDRGENVDSGAPWVDDNGKLLALHYGWESDGDGYSWDVGPVGRPALDSVEAKLYK